MIDKTALKPDAAPHTDLLAELYEFLRRREYIIGDRESIHQMVKTFKNPPLTLRTPVAMKMTRREYARFDDLMKRVEKALKND